MSNGPSRKRSNNRNQGGNSQANGAQQNGQPSRNKSRKNRSKAKRVDPLEFWGDPTILPVMDTVETATPDPLAVPRSLGKAPVHGSPTERYFALIYTRSSALAAALGHIVAGAEEIEVEQPIRE